ncbi:helix-turn-helix transcriptional regulator [Streptomyces sp. AV19]|uniref:helix-turn-helix domain-containing protein n=1 Tax=Streptomyces sp. AV19 TaxID=2793068 RepID=UPI0018FE9D27|nr:helix-turn-helix domain-containing protein [Streptomyces sp. AV19]MBH1932924.1 helix-turn-helix transcriptional regulator [Streptomyces sp. AV19]MDG4531674.1 helix-turn-helix domain-containing protein [Streptomyces sp. AV19]
MAFRDPLFLLWDRDLLLRLMKRTGSGHKVTVRELAERSGVAVGTVGDLASGARSSVTATTAQAICQGIGVDLLILFTPIGRSVPSSRVDNTPSVEQVAA